MVEREMDEREKAAEAWSEDAAASVVEELIVAGLLIDPEKNVDWARRIISQDLFIGWISGGRLHPPPPDWLLTRKS